MKKRMLSLLLTLAMLIGIMAVPAAAATETPGYALTVKAVSGKTAGSRDVLKMTVNMQAVEVGASPIAQTLILSIDNSVLEPVGVGGQAVTGTSLLAAAQVANWGQFYDASATFGAIDAPTIHVDTDAVPGRTLMKLRWTARSGAESAFAGGQDLFVFNLALKDGKTKADVDSTVLSLATVNDVISHATADDGVALIAKGADDYWVYGKVKTSSGVRTDDSANDNLAKPTFTLDGSPLPAGVVPLNSIKVTLSGLPTAVPTAAQGNNTSGKATAAVGDDSTGATLPTDIKFSIVETHTGIDINQSTGAITVKPAAAAGTYTVKAASASKSKEATAQFTLTKAPAAVASFDLNKTSTSIKRGASETLSVSNIKDQYGATIAGTPAWAVKTDNASGKITVNASTGAVSVAADATVGNTAVISATINGIEKTCTVTVANLDPSATPVVTITGGGEVVEGSNVTLTATATGSGTKTYSWKFKGTEVGTSATLTISGVDASKAGTYTCEVTHTESGKTPAKGTGTATVSIKAPDASATPTVTVTASANPAVEGAAVTLTANVTGNNGGTLTYQWSKDGQAITGATNSTYEIAAMAAANEGAYTCAVTNTETGKTPVSAASEALNLTMKTIPVLTLTAKTGPVTGVSATGWKLSDLVTATPADADIDALFGSDLAAKGVVVTFYEVVKAPASTDPAATGETTSIVPVTTLESGKTYYADIAVTASDSAVEGYKLAATAGKGAPADEAALAGYLKVETASASSGGSYVPSQFTVRYVVGENGTMTGNATETVKRGESPANVPAVTAKEGFYFRGWSQNGKDIVDPTTVTVNSNVTFTALFAATKNTYISGYPDRTFRPDASVTRAEIASMLARLSKDYQANGGYTGSASDVAADAWFANAVNFGLSKGFITGYEDGTFQPDGNITRGEFASMMARYMGLTAAGNKQFTDTQGYWASSAISALADAGIVSGYEDGSFHPGAPLTRAEAVQMINVALKVVAQSAEYEIVPTDVSGGHWAYHQILTAMNTDIKDIVK